MLLVAACVLGVVFSMAAYYDTNLRSGLENKAKTTTDFFSNYISQSYKEYYQSCIRYAESFYAIRTPLYYYTRQRKHSLSSSVNPAQALTTKASLFKYYKKLYVDLGLYEKYRLQIYSYLVSVAKDME